MEKITELLGENKFTIDFEKKIELKDVVEILKAMELQIYWKGEEVPEEFKYLSENGLLKPKW